MAQNIVELGFNVDDLTEQKKQVLLAFQEVFNAGTAINAALGKPLPLSGIQDFNDAQARTKTMYDNLTGATNNLTQAQITNSKAVREAALAEVAQQKAQQETLKTSVQKEKSLKAEQKATADASNEYKQLSLAYNEAALRAKNLQIIAPDSKAAKEATKDAAELGAYLKQIDASVGQNQRNVGNYSSALQGYANTLKGMRGPVNLLAEAFGMSAMEANQLRLVVEHSLQGLAALFKAKSNDTSATNAMSSAMGTGGQSVNSFTTSVNSATAAGEQNTAVQLEQAAATDVVTGSLEAEKVVTEELIVETSVLWALLLPIVAVVAALSATILLAVDAIKSWVNADKDLIEAEKNLANSLAKTQALEKEGLETLKARNELQQKTIKDEIAFAQASGKNKEEVLALENKLAQSQLESATAIQKKYGVTAETVAKSLKDEQEAILNQAGWQKRLDTANEIERENAGKSALQRQAHESIEKLQAQVDNAAASANLTKQQFEFQKSIFDDVTKAQQEATSKGLDINKTAADAEAKILEAHNQQMYDARKAYNDRVLNDERSTYKQKQDALLGNLNAEIALNKANKEAQKVLLDRDIITQQEYSASIVAINKKQQLEINAESEAQRKLAVDYTNRNNAALFAIDKNNYESRIATEEAITKNTEKELEDRLNAYANSLTEKSKLIEEDYYLQIENAKKIGKTKDEIDTIESAHIKAKIELTANSEKEVYDITKSYLDKKAKDIEESNKGTSNSGNTENYQKQSEDLNNSLHNNIISYSEYIAQKKQLDEQYSIESASAQVNDDQKKLGDLEAFQIDISQREITAKESELKALEDAEKKNNEAILNAKQKLSADKKKLSDAEIASEIAARKKLADTEKQLETAVVSFVKNAIDAGYENRERSIEKQIAITDKMYENEEAAVQRSSLNATDKAALEIQLASQKAQADKQAAADERKLKRDAAKADRDIKIDEIAAATALAEVQALTYLSNPLTAALYPAIAAAIAATGIAEAAALLATPPPSYAEGTLSHPGGIARYGEDGAEIINEPGKSPWIAYTETISYLPKGTQVIPMNKISTTEDKGGMNWEQTRYLASVIKKSQKDVVNNITVPAPVVDIDFQVYYNQKLRGFN